MSISKVLVTGASGFVGSVLAQTLERENGIPVRRAYRSAASGPDGAESVTVGDIGPATDWSDALTGIDAVVHCAARVHVMDDDGSTDSLAQFRKVNVQGTRHLARQAAIAGVRRFVFVSSIKVNGETTTGLPPFMHSSRPAPADAYGISKWEAEQELWDIAQQSGLEVVVVRPPLVYGPGVKANFLRLMQAVDRGIPLPFGAVRNQRSMVFVKNLTDLLTKCVTHPRAVSRTFLVSDGQDLSTAALVAQLATALNKKARLVNVPPSLMHSLAALVGKRNMADRLLGSLQVDIAHTRDELDWKPPFTVEEGLKATAVVLMAAGVPQVSARVP
jgi:nucleoside-diphosphate-sugar epimerase